MDTVSVSPESRDVRVSRLAPGPFGVGMILGLMLRVRNGADTWKWP